jgi:hypothetical protein
MENQKVKINDTFFLVFFKLVRLETINYAVSFPPNLVLTLFLATYPKQCGVNTTRKRGTTTGYLRY